MKLLGSGLGPIVGSGAIVLVTIGGIGNFISKPSIQDKNFFKEYNDNRPPDYQSTEEDIEKAKDAFKELIEDLGEEVVDSVVGIYSKKDFLKKQPRSNIKFRLEGVKVTRNLDETKALLEEYGTVYLLLMKDGSWIMVHGGLRNRKNNLGNPILLDFLEQPRKFR